MLKEEQKKKKILGKLLKSRNKLFALKKSNSEILTKISNLSKCKWFFSSIIRRFQKEKATHKLNKKNEASKDRIKLQTFFNKLIEEY